MANQKIATAAGVEVTQKEVTEAHKDAALEYMKDGAKAAMVADTGTTGETDDQAAVKQVAPDLNTTFLAPLLDLPLDTLVQRLSNDKVDGFIDFENAKGLLALERNGRNRTEHVKALMARLGKDAGVKHPYEVAPGGPSYTNDTSNVTDL